MTVAVVFEFIYRGILKKVGSENMLQIYRRTPMLKCDFKSHFSMGVLL